MSSKFTLISALAFLIATPALSEPDYPISLRGIDFATAAGPVEFEARVARAGRRACSSGYIGVARLACRYRFRNEALAQLPAPVREAYLESRPVRRSQVMAANIAGQNDDLSSQ